MLLLNYYSKVTDLQKSLIEPPYAKRVPNAYTNSKGSDQFYENLCCLETSCTVPEGSVSPNEVEISYCSYAWPAQPGPIQ